MISIFKKLSAYFAIFINTLSFSLLLMLYLCAKGAGKVFRCRFFPKFLVTIIARPLTVLYDMTVRLLGSYREGSVSRIALIKLSIRNLQAKKTRTMITVGGMAIGIGVIVFLVSIGYGLQQLVITRVARLEEMRQFDVSPQVEGKVKINDETLSGLKDVSSIESVMPLISVVGRVNYNDSVSDMVVYGVTSEYLKQSAIQPSEGDIFESDVVAARLAEPKERLSGSVDAGSVMEFDQKIRDVAFSVDPGSWVRVRETPKPDSKLLGYAKGIGQGGEYWGASYDSADESGTAGISEDGTVLGKWVRADVPLWEEGRCDQKTQGDCEDGKHKVFRDTNGEQIRTVGYFAEIGVEISNSGAVRPSVLGDSTDLMNNAAEWVSLDSESDAVTQPNVETAELPPDAKRQAVVNRSALKVLGIDEHEAVGRSFLVTFVVVGDLLADTGRKMESVPAEYEIVGVTPDEKSPVFYVPFMDLRSLGIVNFSQVKAVARSQTVLPEARKHVEAMGYVTRSVADTVSQINSLFATARIALVILGMTALAISALGMFNTLTVSLLERTREVGLMKAMGMKSIEARELFLTESMIMGIFGGTLGLLSGYLLGKLVSLSLSFFSLFSGLGYMDISFVPLPFAIVILLLSLFVGFGTGIYPANRSTKISALDALRYE